MKKRSIPQAYTLKSDRVIIDKVGEIRIKKERGVDYFQLCSEYPHSIPYIDRLFMLM